MSLTDPGRLRTHITCVPSIGHNTRESSNRSTLVLSQRSTEGQTELRGDERLVAFLGPMNTLGQVPVEMSWIHPGQDNCMLNNLCFLLRGSKAFWRTHKIFMKGSIDFKPLPDSKAWSQQITKPVSSELSCDPQTLQRSETLVGYTEEAETTKAGQRKDKHRLPQNWDFLLSSDPEPPPAQGEQFNIEVLHCISVYTC